MAKGSKKAALQRYNAPWEPEIETEEKGLVKVMDNGLELTFIVMKFVVILIE